MVSRLFLLLGALFLFSPPATLADRSAGNRPHILLILADDIGIDGFGCYGGTSYATPRIDALAATGMRFTHAYSQPLCTPTRVELMTGRDNHRNWTSFGILDPSAITIGHRLQAAGYHTHISGKWQLFSYDPPDFPGAEKRRGTGMHPAKAGFDDWHLYHALETEDKGSRYADPTISHNGELKTYSGGYGADVWTRMILESMDRHRDQPQFVYFPMALPHWPFVPTPHSEDWADPEKRHVEDLSYFKDMVEYMDFTVGELIDGLDRLKLRQDTVVIFYSDNGTHLKITSRMNGRDIPGGKATPLQTGIHVPLVINWPGQIKSGVSHDLVEASDILPTVAELAQIEVEDDWQCDGQSFVPQLFGEPGQSRTSCFFWYDSRPGWDKARFRRHVFALDKTHKLFSDGSLFRLDPAIPLQEIRIPEEDETSEDKAARRKLEAVIQKSMSGSEEPPLVDAYGNPSTE